MVSTHFFVGCVSLVFFLFRPARAWSLSPGQGVLAAALGFQVPNSIAALQGQGKFPSLALAGQLRGEGERNLGRRGVPLALG
jgi:hypothetical protein